MFQVFCATHGSRVLLDATRIDGLYNTRRGPAVVWRCYCGEQGSLLNGVSRPLTTMAAPPRPGDDASAVVMTASEAA